MYRRTVIEQLKLEIPFGVPLDTNNRWVKLSSIMPWGKIEEVYAKNFKSGVGQVAKSGRLAFGALYIQGRLAITDEETVSQIQETPSMQFFCGFESYSPEKPFDSSLMVHFRKRLTPELVKEIAEEAFVSHAKKAIEKESGNDGDSDGGTPKGTLLLDATCCPADIHYPTDAHLLNHARELTEEIIDRLHEQSAGSGITKPRTYRNVARRAYLEYAKKRRKTRRELRFVLRRQLQYVRRNLSAILKQVEAGASLDLIDSGLRKKLMVVSKLYRQQKQMFDDKTNSVKDRIVSIAQPHLRPIVRGKSGVPVEFGAKVATAHIGGFTFIIHLDYDNFSESKYLEKSAEEYKRLFGFYPKVIIGDKAYATNENRNFCTSKCIRLSAPRRGRKSAEVKEAERKQLYEDGCIRNAIEGDYGVVKRKYGLSLVKTKLPETTLTTISVAFFIKNIERVMRLLVLLYLPVVSMLQGCPKTKIVVRSRIAFIQ